MPYGSGHFCNHERFDMSKKKRKPRTPSPKHVRDFMNDELEFIRERCPSLVVVAASLLPFKDVCWRIGVASRDESAPEACDVVLLDVMYPHNPPDCDTIVEVDEEQALIKCVDEMDGEVISVHETTLPGLWEFLRSIPRSVAGFANYIPPEPCPDCGSED